MAVTVREASPADLDGLVAIEWSGDQMFAVIGIRFPPGPSAVTEAIEHGADILVAGDPPVGFAALTRVDGNPHLAQISVLASQAGRGTGSALLAGWQAEIDAGLHELGPRLAMVHPG